MKKCSCNIKSFKTLYFFFEFRKIEFFFLKSSPFSFVTFIESLQVSVGYIFTLAISKRYQIVL